VGVLVALVVTAAGAISAGALAGSGTNAVASQTTPITHVCANKSSGQLFYLASCKKSQSPVDVSPTAEKQFKACYLASNGVTRKVSDSTTCSENPRKKENTIPKVPADSDSLYFCVKSSDGTMYFKGTSEPTCSAGQYAVGIGPHNRPPVADDDGPYSVAEDGGPLTVAAPGVLANDSEPDGDPTTAELVDDVENGTLTLNSDGSFSYTPDADYNGSDSFTYKAKDNHDGLSAAATVSITVTPVNDSPTNITLSNASVDENEPAGTTVGTLSTTDPDSGDTHTYSLVSGTGSDDNGSFEISSGTLQTNAQFDFETKSSYTIRVKTDDGNGGTSEKALTISITNANDQPSDIALSNSDVDENQPAGTDVGTLSTTDQDSGDTFTYTLVSGTGDSDNNSFQISGSTLETAAALNFEDGAARSVRVETDDGNGGTSQKQFTITVNDANDGPTNLALSNNTVDDNQPSGTTVGTFSADDEDSSDTQTFTFASGVGDTDNSSFQITGDTLKTNAAFDFEAKDSYSIRVKSDDGNGGTVEEEFTISVSDANDQPSDIALSNASVDENQPSGTTVGTLSTIDQDSGDTHTYTLVSGTGSDDNGSFQITNGTLQTNAKFDFETKDSYTVRVQTDDGNGGTVQEQLTVTVVDANDQPSDIALSNDAVVEHQPSGTSVGTFSSTDQDSSDTHTYTLASGTGDTDNSSFQISGSELQTDADLATGTYSILVQTDDGNGGTFEEQFTITVVPPNFDPTDISLSNSSVDENQPSGTGVGTLSTTDPDSGDTHTYKLVAGSGDTDNASFQINGSTLETAAALDYEQGATRSVRVETDDGNGGTFEEEFTITVGDANDPPTNISLSNDSIDENKPSGTDVGTFSSTDQDSSDTHAYTLVSGTGGDDNSSFTISGDTLKSAASFDYESKDSYKIRVRVDDGKGGTFDKQLTISITNANDVPTDISLSNSSVAENQPSGTDVGTLSTTDQDSADTHTYSLVAGTGDTDNAQFTISGDTLQTNAQFNHEVKDSYTIRVKSDDGNGGTFEKEFTITVGDTNDSPTDIALSSSSVGENQPSGATVGTLSTTDPDTGDTFTYSLVSGTGSTDNASFTIDGDTLKTSAAFDFETKASYSIRVRSTDSGSDSTEKEFTISVNDLNDAPTDISLSNDSIDENKPAGTTVGSLLAADPDSGQTHSFSLADSGCGGGPFDNSSFSISGGDLKSATSFDFEADSSYTICVRATDNGSPNLSFDEQFTITINDANDPPVVTTSGGANTFTEDGAPVTVDGGLTVADPDSANMAGATVSITSNFASGQDELLFTDTAEIDGTYNASTGALTLTGPATKAQYETALRSITFRNTSQNPSSAARTVSFVVNDGSAANNLSNAATRSVNVTPVNDAPTLTQPDGALSYTEDTPSENHQLAIAPNLTVTDVDSTTIQSASVQITGNYQSGQDVLSFAAANGISGSFDAPSGKLTLTHASGTKTFAEYETALRSVKYSNTSENPSAATRTVTFQANDGGSVNNLSNTAMRDITVTPTNDAPLADDETFTGTNSAVGNTALVVNDPSDGPPSVTGPKKSITGDILDGDTDVDGPGSLAVQAGTFTTNDGGSVTIEADGDFTYVNDPADACADTSDFFDYTVTDGNSPTAGTDTGRVNVSVAGCVWYVSNNATGNNGTSAAPFDTLAQAQTASAANHTIFVFDGDNTTTGYGAGIDLKANQKLIGEAATLTVGSDTLHTGDPLKRPTITDNNDDVVALAAANEVRGVELDPQGTGGGIAGASGDTGGTIDDVRVIDTGTAGTQPGLELDATTGTFNISNLTVSTNGATGVRLNNAGTTNFASTGTVSITTSGARGLDATNTNMGTGSVFDDITVTGSGSGGVSMSGTTGTTTFGDGTGTDLSLTTTSSVSPAFGLTNAGTVAVPAGGTANVGATGGPAIDVTGTSGANLAFDDVDSTNSTTDGINLDGLGTGTFSASSGDIGGAGGIAFDLNSGSGAITYPGNLGNGSGATAEITGRSGGAVTLNGQISDTIDTGGGISLSGNTGGSTTFGNASKVVNTGTAGDAIRMTTSDGHTLTLSGGGLDIDTTSGKGLEADTSGTLNVTGTGNTITTTTGTALNATNTDIGASDLTFQSISANGAPNGIVLNNTGTSGNLTVTGTGGTCTIATPTCTGGTIQNTTGDGISLTNTRDVSLSNMRIRATGRHGIGGTSVTNFTFSTGVVDEAGDADNEGAIFFGTIGGANLVGTALIENSAFNAYEEVGVHVRNDSGSLALTVNNSDFTNAKREDGVLLETFGTATVTALVQNSRFSAMASDGITAAANAGTLNFTAQNNTFTGCSVGCFSNPSDNAISVGSTGVNPTRTNLKFNLHNNTMNDSHNSAIIFNINGHSANDGRVTNNTITNTTNGYGIDGTLAADGNPDGTNPNTKLLISGNAVSGQRQSAMFFNANNAANLDATILSNTMNTRPADATAFENLQVTTNGTSNVCADIRANSIARGGSNAGGIGFDAASTFLDDDATTTFRLERGISTSSDPATVYLANNPSANGVLISEVITLVDNGTCQDPATTPAP